MCDECEGRAHSMPADLPWDQIDAAEFLKPEWGVLMNGKPYKFETAQELADFVAQSPDIAWFVEWPKLAARPTGLRCRECHAYPGEVLPRNEYNPPRAREMRSCGICRYTYCDWCFGPHYCGEGEETAPNFAVPEGYRLSEQEAADY